MSIRVEEKPLVFEMLKQGTNFIYNCYDEKEKKGLFDVSYSVLEKGKDFAKIKEILDRPELRIVRKLKIYKDGRVLEIHESETDYPFRPARFWIFLRWINPNEIKIGMKRRIYTAPMPYQEIISEEYIDSYPVYRCREYKSDVSSQAFYHKPTGLLLKTVCVDCVVELKSTNLPQLEDYKGKYYTVHFQIDRRFIYSYY